MPLRAAACSCGAGRDALAVASTLTQLRADFDAACVEVHAALREGPRNPAWPTPRKVLGWPLRGEIHAVAWGNPRSCERPRTLRGHVTQAA